MDKGLKLQVELTKKGEKIFSEISRIIKDLDENYKMYYLMSIGINLCVTEEHITVWLIMGKEIYQRYGIGIMGNPYKDRVITKEAICNYLINNQDYSFDINRDISEDLTHPVAKYRSSTIQFWFNN